MAKLTKAKREQIIEILEGLYPAAETELSFGDSFQLLVAVVLSAQTTDAAVNKVTPELFTDYPDPLAMSKAKLTDLENILKTIGLYRTKAKNIVGLSKLLVDRHGGRVPGDYEELLKLPGVGRKTANVVLAVGFGVPRIAVDTHVFRLANRIGFTREKDVLKTELALMEVLPEEKWIDMHHALILHGRRVCIARNPKCDLCPIADLCCRNGLEKMIKGPEKE